MSSGVIHEMYLDYESKRVVKIGSVYEENVQDARSVTDSLRRHLFRPFWGTKIPQVQETTSFVEKFVRDNRRKISPFYSEFLKSIEP